MAQESAAAGIRTAFALESGNRKPASGIGKKANPPDAKPANF
jgi:hypothetical protein